MAADRTGVSISARYTLEFVERHLPEGSRQLLEVGCGDGELAQLLQSQGFAVVAVDSDRQAVEQAQRRGVDARVVEWPGEAGRDFDAVLFTRSLHHVHGLKGAVVAAVGALRAGGRVIVEDFRAEGGSGRSGTWFAGLARLLDAARAFGDAFDLEALLAKADTSADEHQLHSSTAIAEALEGFGQMHETDAAYYFRYFEPELTRPDAAASLLEHELALIAADAIDPLGKRFVLTPRESG